MKKRFIVFFVFVFCLNVNSTELKVLWWNVHNFFDTVKDRNKDDIVLTREQYKNKLNLISEKIADSKADIVGLAEVENIGVLKDIAYKAGYPYFYLEEGNDPRGIDVGLLSKYRVDYKSHKNQPTPYKKDKSFKFSRDCTEAFLNVDGKNLYILTTHLKSKVNGGEGKNDEKRIGQVNGILDIISEIYKNSKSEPMILLMGDFNSNRHSEELNIIEKSGLKILNYLKNENDFYSTVYKHKKQDIDYIILNKKLYDSSKIRKYKTLNSNEYKTLSDHFPIYLEFSF
jgi:endonuclease/exonuclease/phosphatase family metal-dependent hydrolase